MRVVFLGTGDFGAPALRALAQAGHSVLRAISQPDRPAGRGRQVQPTAIHALADQLGIPHTQTSDVNAENLRDLVADAEIGVVAAFGQKIGPQLLALPPRGCVNIHGSLLPRYRGAAPYQWAIINGDSVTGITIFQLDQRWDHGPVWLRRETPIGETETADELHDRLGPLGAAAIVDVLTAIESGTARPEPQDASQATRAPKLSKADGVIDWSQPAAVIARRINGLWSWPGAACTLIPAGGTALRVRLARASARPTSADANLEPTAEFPPGAFRSPGRVQAVRGCVHILELQAAGGRKMALATFANGHDLRPPARLAPAD